MPPAGRDRHGRTDRDDGVFVARGETLRAVDEYVATGDGAFRRKAIGTWGIGKSQLTLELERRVEEDRRATAIRLVLGSYTPAAAAPGRDPSTKTLVHNFDRYCKFLRDLAVAGGSRAFKDLEQSIAIALHAVTTHQAVNFSPTVNIGDDATFGDDADVGSFTYVSSAEDPKLDAVVLGEKSRLTEAFVTALKSAGRDYGVVLLLDDFDKIRGHLLAGWVLELICDGALDNVVVLLAAGPAAADMDDGGRLDRYDLEVFTTDEVHEYLCLRFGSAEPELVEQVLAFSGGLPHAVAMAADVVAQRVRRGDPANIDGVGGEEWSSVTADLLSTIVAEVPDEDDRVVLRSGRLARRLDDRVLGALLRGDGTEPGAADPSRVAAVRNRLVDYSFVESYDDPDLGRSFRFHHYIDQVDGRLLGALQVDEEAVHEILAEHYERRLDDYDEAEAATKTGFGSYFKYEHPGWQKLVQEWAHHAAQLHDPARHERARIYLACAFLEALWWWGCYVKFPFCEAMLDEWDAAHPEGDSEWSDLLRLILASYPPGHLKDDQPGWPLVEKALVRIRTATGIHSKSARLDDSSVDVDPARGGDLARRRRLRALTSLFLAHTYKYREQYRSYARSFFDDALTWLERCGDQVAIAWTRVEVAELCFSLGEASWPMAREELRSAMRQALDEDRGDYELLANLHRLDSDLHWAAGDVDEAIDGIVGAVVRAYGMQVDPHPPDLYTVTFYQEMLTRLGNRLADVHARSGEVTALTACRRALAGTLPIRVRPGNGEPTDDELRCALAAGGMALGVVLAPPPPSAEQLYTPDSSFVTEACMVVGSISNDLDAGDEALAATV